MKPDTLLGWYRRLIARQFDGSKSRRYPGRPRIYAGIEYLVVRMAKANSHWGYDRIVGAMANLGYSLSDQTVGNILQRHGIPPAPDRKCTTTWTDFIRAHMSVHAGTDLFSVEVLTLRRLVTYYVLFFTHLESRRVEVAGITRHPNEVWMKQIARNVTMDEWGFLYNCSYLIHDCDTKFTDSFRDRQIGSCRAAQASSTESEFERPCRALGKIGEGGSFVKADSILRGFVEARDRRVPGAFSCRTKSSRQRQCASVSAEPSISAQRGAICSLS